MAYGSLKIFTTMGKEAEPVGGVSYAILDTNGKVLFNGITNENGESAVYQIEAPDKSLSQTPNSGVRPYSVVDAWVGKTGFRSISYKNVEIYDGVEGILPAEMVPFSGIPGQEEEITIVIPPPTVEVGEMNNTNQQQPPETPESRIGSVETQSFTLNSVVAPEYITVHLGTPGNTSAQNVRVRFIDYIKNVVSSEIYPTWPTNSIIANIHVIVTFALNRIYTEWYRSRGFNYDITNSTTVDQYFVYGREIYANISQLVDGLFNVYAHRQGFKNPYFTSYCNGTTSTCKGLSQWGTVTLANQGLTPLQILHRYYPQDLVLATAPTSDVTESYPGQPLALGSSGASVQRMQMFLNRIRGAYPSIPAIVNPNGTFDAQTQEAVRIFQRTFNLVQDGIVGRSTWNKITQVYGAVTGLSELGGEGERIGLSPTPPTSIIRQGSRGADVIQAQFLLNYISQFYPSIPSVVQDSIFGATTADAVRAFQRQFGLNPDGIVGPNTWARMYDVARDIIGQQPPEQTVPPIAPPTAPTTPPPTNLPTLRQGSRGADVVTLQTMLNKARVTFNAIPLLAPDGIFGPMTNTAVRTFQLYSGLVVDGIVGPRTWAALQALQ